MSALSASLALAAILAVPAAAAAGPYPDRPIWGTVYVDDDGDGVLSGGDTRVEGAAVFFGTARRVTTDERGQFRFDAAPGRADVVWVRIPEGFEPAPVWRPALPSVPLAFELPLVRRRGRGPCRFTVAADTHTGLPRVGVEHLAGALRAMTELEPPPCFYTVLGDITQDNGQWQYDLFRAAAGGIDVPFVPVPGNHDWWDGGAAFRRNFGPPSYAFDIGGARYVVLNDSAPIAARLAFLELVDRDREPTRPLVALTHSPVQPEIARALGARGVSAVFSGHLHANRVHHWSRFSEYATQPLVMGGIDQSPAGYRVVDVGTDGAVSVDTRLSIKHAVVSVVHPLAGSPVTPGPVDVVVAAHTGAALPRVRARVDGGAWLALSYRGGWAYSATVELDADARLEVEVAAPGRAWSRRTVDVTVARAGGAPVEAGAWTDFGGGDGRHGRADAGPQGALRQLWARPVGDLLHGGAPIVARGRVLVSLADFGAGATGGVVALDAHTGAELWRYRAGAGVRNAAAVDGDIAVFGSVDGVVHAVDLPTGALRWRYELAPEVDPLMSTMYASPIIDGGVVYAGIQREVVALALEDGRRLWTVSPGVASGWWSPHAGPVRVGNLLVGVYGRAGAGVVAVDIATGRPVWRRQGPETVGIEGSLIAADGAIVFANEWSDLIAVDAATGATRWQTRLSERVLRYGQAVQGAPAYADGVVFVPTMHGELVAVVPRADGGVLWRAPAPTGPLYTCHYRADEANFAAGPVVVGDTVWIGGPDGVLRALDRHRGTARHSLDLGAPILSRPTAAGDILYVATVDGVVHALVEADRADPVAPAAMAPIGRRRGRGLATAALVTLAVFLVLGAVSRLVSRW